VLLPQEALQQLLVRQLARLLQGGQRAQMIQNVRQALVCHVVPPVTGPSPRTGMTAACRSAGPAGARGPCSCELARADQPGATNRQPPRGSQGKVSRKRPEPARPAAPRPCADRAGRRRGRRCSCRGWQQCAGGRGESPPSPACGGGSCSKYTTSG